MKRALILPVSAAAIGVSLALGVFALKRAAMNAWEDQTFEVRIDGTRHVVVDAADVRLRGETLREVLEQVSQEVRDAVEADRELTEAERAAIERFSTQFLNKLLHEPTDVVRRRVEAGAGGEYVRIVRELFDLGPDDEDRE